MQQAAGSDCERSCVSWGDDGIVPTTRAAAKLGNLAVNSLYLEVI